LTRIPWKYEVKLLKAGIVLGWVVFVVMNGENWLLVRYGLVEFEK
jgi:hypothetical protein